jgi:3-phenylpropionate/cinnamic acid dioxygenase small subunit
VSDRPLEKALADVLFMQQLTEFYNNYFRTLDNGELSEWPSYFSDECLYQVIPRENYERGYGLCTILADSKGMLIDRVASIAQVQMFAPRFNRRFYSGLRIVSKSENTIKTEQNVLVIQTLQDKPSEVLVCGKANDSLERPTDGAFRFTSRVLVLDTEMIPNSLIYPA